MPRSKQPVRDFESELWGAIPMIGWGGWPDFRTLGFTQRDVERKRLLDVGAGYAGTALNWGNCVYGVDPNFGYYRQRSLQPTEKARQRGVVAVAGRLPFRANTFHHVFSTAAVGDLSQIPFVPALVEMLRVTRSGGDVRLLVGRGNRDFRVSLNRVLPHLKAAGILYSVPSREKETASDLLVFKRSTAVNVRRLRKSLKEKGLV